MNDGVSLMDVFLSVVIVFVIADLTFSLSKIDTHFEYTYSKNLSKIEERVKEIYE